MVKPYKLSEFLPEIGTILKPLGATNSSENPGAGQDSRHGEEQIRLAWGLNGTWSGPSFWLKIQGRTMSFHKSNATKGHKLSSLEMV